MTSRIATVLLTGLCLGGCVAGPTPPLMFVQTQTVGIAATGGTASQGAEMTFGYRDFDVAIVPTVVSDKDGNPVKNADGTVARLTAYNSSGQCNAAPSQPAGSVAPTCGTFDALSVLGQFEVGTSGGTNVTLGKFFATGTAASTLADGFKAKLSK
ncbi:MAG TPA: hypothetical protein VGB91_09675 [Rhizomicrobium sp.]